MQNLSRFWHKAMLGLALALALAGLLLGQASAQDTPPETDTPTVDHSQLDILKGPFETPQDVTKACLACHADAADEIMHTTHWTWEYVNEVTGQTVGKKNLINNFCIDIQSNEPRCTSCHIGYGWKDKNFDFTLQENIDCLVCHDTTGEYKKFPTGAGLPVSEPKEFPAGSGNIWAPPDLAKVAQNIGLTSRQTCGSCHFYGGGGDEVKHGDLDSSLVNPSFELDVHMSVDGQNFTCTTCHMTSDHEIVGSRYSMDPEQWKGCETCHGEAPHALASLNQHTQKIACQTCHIPEYARGGIPTKMTWDWSKAGELSDGKPVVRKDETGHVIYDGQKGEFTYGADVVPEYVWFNGQVQYTLAGDKIDPTGVVNINQFQGDKDDPQARIWPVKRFEAIQPYDSVNNILIIPHLFGKDEFAYWGNYDWNNAITFGMEYAGLPYSGKYDFVTSQMYWPITHMVAPANQALTCRDCHTAQDSRLDFAGLGYSDAEISRLTSFPPSTTIGNIGAPQLSPDTCINCHKNEHSLWMESSHSQDGVGCVACHHLQGAGEHPGISFTMEKDAETCGTCHIKEYEDWKGTVKGQMGITCVACHNPHSQQPMTVEPAVTVCENCHREQWQESQHSTHHIEGVTCTDCHMNTTMNTGHTFKVGSDTCATCHGENIHIANELQGASAQVTPEESPLVSETEANTSGLTLPIWVTAFFVVVLGVGGFVLFGKHEDHPGNGKSNHG